MASQRLSKLQKWILKTCYENCYTSAFYENGKRIEVEYVVPRRNLLGRAANRNAANVSISRSIRGLFKKGFIDVYIGWYWLILDEQCLLKRNLADLDKFKDASDDTVVYEGSLKRTKKDMREVIESRKKIVYDRSTDAWHKDYVKMIRLTPEGVAKAQELLKAKGEKAKT